jgi:hypothetical protein
MFHRYFMYVFEELVRVGHTKSFSHPFKVFRDDACVADVPYLEIHFVPRGELCAHVRMLQRLFRLFGLVGVIVFTVPYLHQFDVSADR